MTKIRAAIIDDELNGIKFLNNLLRDYCPDIEVLGTARGVKEGIQLINQVNPELIFLDIEMKDGDGFDLLKSLDSTNFEVVFTTAFEEYAIRAFDFSAIHYLLKPINLNELQKVIHIYKERRQNVPSSKNIQLEVLKQNLSSVDQKIVLSSSSDITFVELKKVIRCEADKNYTVFYLNTGEKRMVSKNLGFYETLLAPYKFVRIHHKHLVNLNYVSRYIRGKGGFVELNDNTTLDVSARKKDILFEQINRLLGGAYSE